MRGSSKKGGGEDDVGGRVESKGFRCERSTVLDDENDRRDVVEGVDGVGSLPFVNDWGGREEFRGGSGDGDENGFG